MTVTAAPRCRATEATSDPMKPAPTITALVPGVRLACSLAQSSAVRK